MKNNRQYLLLKKIIQIFLIFLILGSNICFSAESNQSGREWRRYVETDNGNIILGESCKKIRELPDMIQGQPIDFDDGMTIMNYLTTAETKTKEEDEQLKLLMEAFMNADENGNPGKNWKLKVSIDGINSEADRLEANYQAVTNRIKESNNASNDSPEGGQGSGQEGGKKDENGEEKIDWKSLKVEDIEKIGDAAEAQRIYDALMNSYVNYEESNEVINDYVKKLIALKNSLGFKNLQNGNPYITDKNLEERLRNIGLNNVDMLDEDTFADISDKKGGNVDLSVDNTGEKLIHIYKQPKKITDNSDMLTGDGIDKIVEGAENFTSAGENDKIANDKMQSTFSFIYNIFFQIGVGLSVIIGLVLGIKFILSGIEEKAEVKKMLGVYVIACIVIYGSFGIWKLVLNILGSM